ncbi:hypothetical protein EAL2_808p06840 (plasmid) [Peptoclostridium acidaminophilum DSM 3953]|uniref:Bacterial bifunctional deaminase-reductase C-terminal domain-containing protein n=1 Tax=Peptoclostridium acidaminophilum DSM 3953 TaxID=1286171 RepID=W8TQ20_PEPAC|nr:dihydrofolate reductase family protein [Peptoclostridium acidaminophilum]AHM58187.1 hypothetical protein EAL2_808p06840 [Peptoclostridium acidaminophilum DSM 3953]
MDNKRKVILYIAQSLDGFIADENGGIDWLAAVELPGEDYGYSDFINNVDTVIMGRRTYETVLSFGIEFPHKDIECYVMSTTLEGFNPDVEFFNGDIGDLIRMLELEDGKDIFIDGGSEVVRELRERDLIDEYIISIVPILLGKGTRLFKESSNRRNLRLLESKAFESGLVQVRYVKV